MAGDRPAGPAAASTLRTTSSMRASSCTTERSGLMRAAACHTAEAADKAVAPPLLDRVRDALEIALPDVAAYRHALMLGSPRG